MDFLDRYRAALDSLAGADDPDTYDEDAADEARHGDPR